MVDYFHFQINQLRLKDLNKLLNSKFIERAEEILIANADAQRNSLTPG